MTPRMIERFEGILDYLFCLTLTLSALAMILILAVLCIALIALVVAFVIAAVSGV